MMRRTAALDPTLIHASVTAAVSFRRCAIAPSKLREVGVPPPPPRMPRCAGEPRGGFDAPPPPPLPPPPPRSGAGGAAAPTTRRGGSRGGGTYGGGGGGAAPSGPESSSRFAFIAAANSVYVMRPLPSASISAKKSEESNEARDRRVVVVRPQSFGV